MNLNAGGGGRNWFGFTRGTTTGNGSGTLHVSSGSFFTNSPTGIGFDENAGSSIAAGVVHQTGGTISFNSWISSGTRDQGRATFNIEGGTFNANSEFSLGELAGGQATFSLSNNAVTNINNLHVGRSGSTGTVNC